MGRFRDLVGVAAGLLVAVAGVQPPAPLRLDGCYRVARPLSDRVTSRDHRLGTGPSYAVQLHAGGAVALSPRHPPNERMRYARASSWRTRGDTLFLRVFDGLTGWDATLRPSGDRHAGHARYLHDDIVPGEVPRSVRVEAVRSACDGVPPA